MMKLLLGLDVAPSPHDVADALAVAICHVHISSSAVGRLGEGAAGHPRTVRSWRQYRP
jgi:Holliday junction endodeoxyribonuclease RuvC-like protein